MILLGFGKNSQTDEGGSEVITQRSGGCQEEVGEAGDLGGAE